MEQNYIVKLEMGLQNYNWSFKLGDENYIVKHRDYIVRNYNWSLRGDFIIWTRIILST